LEVLFKIVLRSYCSFKKRFSFQIFKIHEKLIYCLSFATLLVSCQEKEQNTPATNNSSQLREAAGEFTAEDVEVQEGAAV